MAFSSIQVRGFRAAIPDSIPSHDETLEALELLLDAAWPHYNKAIEAHQDGRVLEALQAISLALRYAPHCAQVVECSIALAVQHGDFEAAQRRLNWAKESGLSREEDWPNYREALKVAIKRWNLFLDDTQALRSHYQRPEASVSYRELLLLTDRIRLDPESKPTAEERAHLEASGLYDQSLYQGSSDIEAGKQVEKAKWKGQKTVIISVMTGLVGLLIGIGGMWTESTPRGPSPPVSGPVDGVQPGSDTPAPNGEDELDLDIAARFARANLKVLEDRPLDALSILDSLEASDRSVDRMGRENISNLKKVTYHKLYDEGISAWDSGDTKLALQMLEPITEQEVGKPQERLYALGMSAAREGRDTLAIACLTRLQAHLTTDYRHYDAQAAYTLVKLLPDDEARRYARHIAREYSDTIYNNSIVEVHL